MIEAVELALGLAWLGFEALVWFTFYCCYTVCGLCDINKALFPCGVRAASAQVATFDCEADVSHQRLCAAVGVRHYPSVLFVGHGSYHASDPLSVKLLGAADVPARTAMYKVCGGEVQKGTLVAISGERPSAAQP